MKKTKTVLIVVGMETLPSYWEAFDHITNDDYDIVINNNRSYMFAAELLKKMKYDYSDHFEFDTYIVHPFHGNMNTHRQRDILDNTGFGGSVNDYASYDIPAIQDAKTFKEHLEGAIILVIDEVTHTFLYPKEWDKL